MKILVFEVSDNERGWLDEAVRRYGVTLVRHEEALKPETLSLLEPADAVCTVGWSVMNEEVFQAMAALDIHVYAARCIGLDHVDLAAAERLGITVINGGYGPEGVAEYTIMLMLMLLRNYKQALWRRQVNDFSLDGLMGRELHEMTIGVVGAGRIGRRVIHLLTSFGCRILYTDVQPSEEASREASYVDLETLYRESDIITLHVPLLESTRHMINRDSLARMKDGVVIINCARGALINVDDVTEAVESGKVGGLGLDVFEKEEGIYHCDRKTDILSNKDMVYLQQLKNVVMTHHIAFYTESAVRDMVLGTLEKVIGVLNQ